MSEENNQMIKNADKKITRGISKEFANALMVSEIYDLYEANKADLFLGIRNEYINLYFNAANVCKVTYSKRKKELRCETAKKYLYGDGDYGKDTYTTISAKEIKNNYETIIENIKKIHSIPEKKAQQQLVYNNNLNSDSKWHCIDIEYVKQRNNSKEETYGRIDIIAISKEKPHRVALIELKYGVGSISGSSGVLKHSQDYIKFIKDKIFETHLRKEIVDIVKSLNELKICGICINNETELKEKPEIYFITLSDNVDKLRGVMRRYFLKNEPGASNRTVEKECGINDITKANDKNFTPAFLFSDNKIEDNKINDIIESELYSKGL
jgi:hypothetical protein